MMASTVEAAQGKWRGVLKHFGLTDVQLNGKHQPCPVCQGTDRWRFDDKAGSGSSFCSVCGAADGIGLLMKLTGWNFSEAAKNVDSIIGNISIELRREDRSEKDKVEYLRKVLKESRKIIVGDPVWSYLQARGGVKSVPDDVRYHSSMKHSSGCYYAVMLSVMRDAEGGGVSLHRTYLDGKGGKANVDRPKMIMPGRPLTGSAVRLGPIQDEIGIAEGIETALAASRIFSLPVWAATNATLLQTWVPPAGVKSVVVFGDNDADGSYAGQAAAYALARRMVSLGIKCTVKIPERSGNDWADEGI